MDLLDLLGAEWAGLGTPAAEPDEDVFGSVAAARCSCSRDARTAVTLGCRESGLAPMHWDDAFGGYVDGMGRPRGCAYCHSCIGTGRTSLRDPWTGDLVDWAGAPCRACMGTGYHHHGIDCAGEHGHLEPWEQLQVIAAFGVTAHGETFAAGEAAPYAGRAERSLVEMLAVFA